MTKPTTNKPNAGTVKFATAMARMQLAEGAPDVDLKETGDMTVAYYKGLPFAAYWFDGDEVVFRFRRPDDDGMRRGVEQYYRDLSTPKNWLEYRRPLSKDSKPNLVAKLADVLGTSFFEFSKGGKELEPVSVDEIRIAEAGE